MANKTNILMVFLVLVIVVLAAFVLYAFVFAPAFSGYVVDKQTEGAVITINQILSQVQQDGFVQIPAGVDADGNPQTLILIPYAPQQAAPAQLVQ